MFSRPFLNSFIAAAVLCALASPPVPSEPAHGPAAPDQNTEAAETPPAAAASGSVPVASEADTAASAPGHEAEKNAFNPKLIWTNASAPLLFPIQWMAASSQGTLLAGSLFSKTFYAYNIYTGECRARQALATPAWTAPLVVGQSAFFSDMSTALTAFDSETCESVWERFPQRSPRRSGDLRQQLYRPRVCKTKPLLYNDKLVTMNTDGLIIFYPNKAPSEGGIPDFLRLQTSPDELGTFLNTPTIHRQVLYACTTAGHLHFVNLNNIEEIGVIKNQAVSPENTIAKEVRVPLVVSSRYIYLTTMDGTVYCYRTFRKFAGSRATAPTQVWHAKLATQKSYQSNRWGRPIVTPVLDTYRNYLFVNAKDCAQALDADTGETVWKHRVPQGIASPPLLWDQYVLIISEPQGRQPAKLAALDPDSGATVAFRELPGVPSCEPLLWEDYLVLGYRNGYAECYHLGNGSGAGN